MLKVANNKILAYPLSSAQRRIWILSRLESGALSYNIGSLININEELDIALMQKTLDNLVARHEVLRTNFIVSEKNEPVQIVLPKMKNEIAFYDISSEMNIREKRQKLLKDNADYQFDLQKDSLVRVCIIKKKPRHYDFFVIMHHIISDIWSLAIFGNEFFHFYNQQKKGSRHEYIPKKLNIQYKDYATWEQGLENQQKLQKQEEYWLKELSGELPILDLPIDRPRSILQTYKTKNESLKIGQDLTVKINRLCQEQSLTPYLFLLSVYNLLLHKLSFSRDIIVGTYSANRDLAELESVIGVFLNNLAIRTSIKPEASFSDLSAQVKEKVLSAIENKEYPFEKLIEKINPARDLARAPIFNTVFQMFSDDDRLKINFFGQAGQRNFVFDNGMSQFDLTMKIFADEKRLKLVLSYNNYLFKKETAQIFLKYYEEILKQLVEDSQKTIADIEIVPATWRKKINQKFNQPEKLGYVHKNVYDLFLDAVEKKPEALALEYNGLKWTYQNLFQEINKAAGALISAGVKKGSIVAVRLKRSEKLFIYLMALLKIGAAYLPINYNEPRQRQDYFLSDSGAGFILSDEKYQGRNNIHVLSIKQLALFRKQLLNIKTAKPSLAYIIYTSGSTGLPKGVKINHSALINFIFGIKEKLNLKPGQKILAATNFSFDIFFLETIAALCQGMTVVLCGENENSDPSRLKEIIQERAVELVQFTPSHLESLLTGQMDLLWLKNIKKIFVGGENFPESLLRKLQKISRAKIYNLYGPTETCIWSSVADLSREKKVQLGKPLLNTEIFVLDEQRKICPPGVIGEIYIGGAGLAEAYTDREATVTSFLPNPFNPKKRVYRTGDFGYFSNAGELFYSGRRDRQIKISGRRLDISEIENCIQKIAGVEQVYVKNFSLEKSLTDLVAYYQTREKVSAEQIRISLQQVLPEYMIPDQFIAVENFPLNSNGKLDWQALAYPSKQINKNFRFSSPENETEKNIIDIWQEVLGLEKIDRNDNFFQLGGHSLQLIKVYNYLENKYPTKLNIAELFVYPTPVALAVYLEKKDKPVKETKVNYRRQAANLIAKVSRGEISANVAAKIFSSL